MYKGLRKRFIGDYYEYLGLLIQQPNVRKSQRTVSIGDIVLEGAGNKKWIYWTLGRIKEPVHGKGGKMCLVKLQTFYSGKLRSI